jgi:tRNA-dihydrouridine synthase
MRTGELLPEPSFEERFDMIVRHMGLLVKLKGEHTGICEMRKHIARYIKGMRNSAQLRDKIFKMNTQGEILEALNDARRPT